MDVSERIETRTCPKHGEYTSKSVMIGAREIAWRCPACDEARTEADRKHAARIDADKLRSRIELVTSRSGIPPRFKDRTLASYDVQNDGQERALRVSQAYVDSWPSVTERGTCLIFSGQPGTGKTHLACAIANVLLAQGIAVLFTTVSDAMRSIKRTYEPGSTMSEGDAINTLVAPRLLILDEVGGSKGSDHELQLMFDIINKRYEQAKPSIILTNLDPVALRAHLGDRVTDRLREGGGKAVTFTWDSHRA